MNYICFDIGSKIRKIPLQNFDFKQLRNTESDNAHRTNDHLEIQKYDYDTETINFYYSCCSVSVFHFNIDEKFEDFTTFIFHLKPITLCK